MKDTPYKPVTITAQTRERIELLAKREGRSFVKQAGIILEEGLRIYEEMAKGAKR